jgi:hypothetical protein
VGHWTPQRWAKTPNAKTPNADVPHAELVQTAAPEGATRADLMFRLVQRLADLAGEAEGRTRRLVPRLDNDLALVDQVRVMVLDLQRAPAPPPLLVRAALAIDATAGAL